MALRPQLASWKEYELPSFLEELSSQKKVELSSKRWGGHQYFHTKNILGWLEQVCVAPPSLGHLFAVAGILFWIPLPTESSLSL